MILAFTEYHGPEVSAKTGKTIPPKAKAGTEWYTFARQLDPTAIRDRLNTPAECTVEVSQNGKFTNRILTSVTFIEAAGPESPTTQTSTPIPTSQPVPKSKPADSPFLSDTARQRLIVRQSSIARAVEVLGPGKTPAEYREWTDFFTDLVFEEEAYGLRENHEGGGDRGDVTPPSPVTPAAKALDAARQKSADIRAGYNDEDAVCPKCGRKEFFGPRMAFCARDRGGCGWPNSEDEREVISYGQWLERQQASNLGANVPWK